MAVTQEGKVFVIQDYILKQVKEWQEEHNKTCPVPTRRPHQFTDVSKFEWRIREMGMGDSIEIVCNCGHKFEPDISY